MRGGGRDDRTWEANEQESYWWAAIAEWAEETPVHRIEASTVTKSLSSKGANKKGIEEEREKHKKYRMKKMRLYLLLFYRARTHTLEPHSGIYALLFFIAELFLRFICWLFSSVWFFFFILILVHVGPLLCFHLLFFARSFACRFQIFSLLLLYFRRFYFRQFAKKASHIYRIDIYLPKFIVAAMRWRPINKNYTTRCNWTFFGYLVYRQVRQNLYKHTHASNIYYYIYIYTMVYL